MKTQTAEPEVLEPGDYTAAQYEQVAAAAQTAATQLIRQIHGYGCRISGSDPNGPGGDINPVVHGVLGALAQVYLDGERNEERISTEEARQILVAFIDDVLPRMELAVAVQNGEAQ